MTDEEKKNLEARLNNIGGSVGMCWEKAVKNEADLATLLKRIEDLENRVSALKPDSAQ